MKRTGYEPLFKYKNVELSVILLSAMRAGDGVDVGCPHDEIIMLFSSFCIVVGTFTARLGLCYAVFFH